MRELTKSMLRFSWALPVFSVKQMISLSMPTEANQASTVHALDAVTAAAESEIGQALKGVYSTGDQMGRTAVDMTFKLLMLDAFNPARWRSDCGCGPTPPSAAQGGLGSMPD